LDIGRSPQNVNIIDSKGNLVFIVANKHIPQGKVSVLALLQRLVADAVIGFNYDYMGIDQFENGSTSRARAELAGFMLDKTIAARRVMFKGTWGVTTIEFKAVVIGNPELVDTLGPMLHLSLNKAPLLHQDPRIRAWMTVGDDTHKLVVFRDEDDARYQDNLARLEKFLQPFAEQIKAKRAADAETATTKDR
jgi:hypothetical protein